ncbi:M1 family metallopeptidase [Draconibacterium sp. IB214405]|uniref:M1 family metallopeptidase n=1 Tax=Draconibacterium sp. IB214405 TaxID=3097352 RepID=UPI002A111BB1|nr:M1 family metallopeptidase [Draconibacterium sp. IB214405]MDX8339858.1 M1 family metallopeptidase [Draconibacterium sp. IB214405]
MKKLALFITFFVSTCAVSWAQENINLNKFRQLKPELATPNVYRTASGAPGHEYWQQKADYKMDIRLDDETQRIYGEEVITYHNQSPDVLKYLWLQLDQNMRAKDSDTYKTMTSGLNDRVSFGQLKRMMYDFDGGFKLDYVQDANGKDLPATINKTMMRVDLPKVLKPGESFTFKVKWWYNINDRLTDGGRSGYEYFKDEDNYIYTIAQFYPRMAVYNEVEGWQHKQFLGTGEFTLPFGDFEVKLTVPADHVVGATGVLQNTKEVLTKEQIDRFEKAKADTEDPVFIVTQEDAEKAEKGKVKEEKTWVFKAENVRDFAFASSRKFIWDAMAVKFGDRTVMAMSYYPKEGNPLWEQYSTRVVAHTVKTYSKFTFDYPYPIAISVHTDRIGMEYPMICFNGGRPESDGTYSKRTKYGMIGVIIHEVGHNFFPMIVNSDERQWTWMDEGLNTFVQFLTEQEWEPNYPSSRGYPTNIVPYMRGDKKFISPVMTNSESVWSLGSNAYAKPSTALNILRETVMGRELFDYAFKEYAQRWMFKHPTPADFFRTMEDASGVDLDWFWRGWFFTTDHCDISMENVKWYQANTKDPEVEKPLKKAADEEAGVAITKMRNVEFADETYRVKNPEAEDFYTTYDQYKVTKEDKEEYDKFLKSLSDEEKELLGADLNFYQIDFKNIGGLVMPVILKFEFTDGTEDVQYIPAEIWRKNNEEISKVFMFNKEVTQITLDPYHETADTDLDNNYWPEKKQPTRFELYKSRFGGGRFPGAGENPMQKAAKK